jgi:hypothetical protein
MMGGRLGFNVEGGVEGGSGGSLNISHLLFADDTFIFCYENMENVCALRCVLLWFEAIMGLRVNLNKVKWCQWER